MRKLFIYTVLLSFGVGALVLFGTSKSGMAEEGLSVDSKGGEVNANSAKDEEDQAPRFMLLGSAGAEHLGDQSGFRNPTERDFDWERLTAGSPASGSDPIIGDNRFASYYDFMDGHPLPYFVAKKR